MLRQFMFVLCAMALLAVVAAAQETPKFEVFGGYSYVRFANDLNMHGGEVSVTGNFTRYLGIEAAYSGHAGSVSSDQLELPPGPIFPGGPFVSFDADSRLHTFLAGPKLALRGSRVTPYAHALFGVAHTNGDADITFFDAGDQIGSVFSQHFSETGFGMALGGGVDLKVTDHVSVRLVQADYLRTQLDQDRASGGQNNARISTGIVFTFGR
jgi:opacity protein-like surface antigen